METFRAAHREPLPMTRAEKKVPGGKLVRLSRDKTGTAAKVQISGDFFIYPEDGLREIEKMLAMLPVTLPESAVETAIEVLITFKNIELIGIDSGTIARLFMECSRCGE